MYQQISLADGTLVGSPGPVPANLVGLSDVDLADVSAAINPSPTNAIGQGWWPVVITTPALNDLTQVAVPPTSYVADTAAKLVRGTATVRSMTVTEFAAANPSRAKILRRQFFQQIALAGLISQDEALAAVGSGTIPTAMMAVINSLTLEQRFPLKMLIASQPTFAIDSPFIPVFAATQGMTDADTIALWLAAGAL